MSGPMAIAATTAVLREVLQSGMTAMQLGAALGGDVLVSVLSPERVVRDLPAAVPQLNLFLYNVSRNTGWANVALPSRDARGERLSNPPLGLDLHYLLTAYGVADYEAEILLGGAMQVMHDTPGLGREAIRAALSPSPTRPAVLAQLQNAGLADQVESLRIVPMPMPSDEISRLWSSFDTPYRPSAAYQVSVVLLESSHSTRSALPVRERGIHVLPFGDLRIDRVAHADGDQVPITAGATLRLIGRGLARPDARVMVHCPGLPEPLDVSAGIISRRPDEIRFTLGPAAALRAGICGVQVHQPLLMGVPPVPHDGFSSNVASFVLTPTITPLAVAGGVDVTCVPPVGARQKVTLLLNERNAAPGTLPRAYSFAAPPGNGVMAPATDTSTVAIPTTAVVPGSYLVRLQVDGAESALTVNGLGRYDQPEVTL